MLVEEDEQQELGGASSPQPMDTGAGPLQGRGYTSQDEEQHAATSPHYADAADTLQHTAPGAAGTTPAADLTTAAQSGATGTAQPGTTNTGTGKTIGPTSGFRGVCWNKKNKRWQAAINAHARYIYLGTFEHEEDAARAFDKAALRLRGLRAALNFPATNYLGPNGLPTLDLQIECVLLEAFNPNRKVRTRDAGNPKDASGRAVDGNGDDEAEGEHESEQQPVPTDFVAQEVVTQALDRIRSAGPAGLHAMAALGPQYVKLLASASQHGAAGAPALVQQPQLGAGPQLAAGQLRHALVQGPGGLALSGPGVHAQLPMNVLRNMPLYEAGQLLLAGSRAPNDQLTALGQQLVLQQQAQAQAQAQQAQLQLLQNGHGLAVLAAGQHPELAQVQGAPVQRPSSGAGSGATGGSGGGPGPQLAANHLHAVADLLLQQMQLVQSSAEQQRSEAARLGIGTQPVAGITALLVAVQRLQAHGLPLSIIHQSIRHLLDVGVIAQEDAPALSAAGLLPASLMPQPSQASQGGPPPSWQLKGGPRSGAEAGGSGAPPGAPRVSDMAAGSGAVAAGGGEAQEPRAPRGPPSSTGAAAAAPAPGRPLQLEAAGSLPETLQQQQPAVLRAGGQLQQQQGVLHLNDGAGPSPLDLARGSGAPPKQRYRLMHGVGPGGGGGARDVGSRDVSESTLSAGGSPARSRADASAAAVAAAGAPQPPHRAHDRRLERERERSEQQQLDRKRARDREQERGPDKDGSGFGTVEDVFAALQQHLPLGAEVDSVLPPKHALLGVIFTVPHSRDELGAGLWDGSNLRQLGNFGSLRDARQACLGAIQLFGDFGGKSGAKWGAAPGPGPGGGGGGSGSGRGGASGDQVRPPQPPQGPGQSAPGQQQQQQHHHHVRRGSGGMSACADSQDAPPAAAVSASAGDTPPRASHSGHTAGASKDDEIEVDGGQQHTAGALDAGRQQQHAQAAPGDKDRAARERERERERERDRRWPREHGRDGGLERSDRKRDRSEGQGPAKAGRQGQAAAAPGAPQALPELVGDATTAKEGMDPEMLSFTAPAIVQPAQLLPDGSATMLCQLVLPQGRQLTDNDINMLVSQVLTPATLQQLLIAAGLSPALANTATPQVTYAPPHPATATAVMAAAEAGPGAGGLLGLPDGMVTLAGPAAAAAAAVGTGVGLPPGAMTAAAALGAVDPQAQQLLSSLDLTGAQLVQGPSGQLNLVLQPQLVDSPGATASAGGMPRAAGSSGPAAHASMGPDGPPPLPMQLQAPGAARTGPPRGWPGDAPRPAMQLAHHLLHPQRAVDGHPPGTGSPPLQQLRSAEMLEGASSRGGPLHQLALPLRKSAQYLQQQVQALQQQDVPWGTAADRRMAGDVQEQSPPPQAAGGAFGGPGGDGGIGIQWGRRAPRTRTVNESAPGAEAAHAGSMGLASAPPPPNETSRAVRPGASFAARGSQWQHAAVAGGGGGEGSMGQAQGGRQLSGTYASSSSTHAGGEGEAEPMPGSIGLQKVQLASGPASDDGRPAKRQHAMAPVTQEFAAVQQLGHMDLQQALALVQGRYDQQNAA